MARWRSCADGKPGQTAGEHGQRAKNRHVVQHRADRVLQCVAPFAFAAVVHLHVDDVDRGGQEGHGARDRAQRTSNAEELESAVLQRP